ncbi:MAG: hypothetical protein DWQ07_01085 [Chloroflexi bacterium]|nr:MAG: hypothetical protein DWQ07_01085 [Chloroflexota bacterium]MBL1196523.1 hypothetical protein [Chloroflexota bacterium]NOH13819.1 hypothetical protein [Chloroflexota bacterium]
MTHTKLASIALVLLLVTLACATEAPAAPVAEAQQQAPAEAPSGPPRSFHLGFTPFPYAISGEAVQYVYDRIAEDADLIAHHFDNGVPWPEALTRQKYSDHLINDWNFRKANTPAGHKVYVAITPINIWRDDLALYWGSEEGLPVPAPWDSYSFNHPDVKTAYLNHAANVVEHFAPDYLNIGIESNLLAHGNPAEWPAYLELHQFVYTELKARYPDLTVLASVSAQPLLEGYNHEYDHASQLQALNELMPYSDIYGISIYPYLTKYLAEPYPQDMWSNLFSLNDKPIAITETGYPAQEFTVTNENITISSTSEKQAAYIQDVINQADANQLEFVINFVLRDYDDLYNEIYAQGDLDIVEIAILWRDTGLYDENGIPRPAWDIWQTALSRRFQELP